MSQPRPKTARTRGIERVRDITTEILSNEAVRVYLFGSSVTGPVRRWSDVDIAIDPLRPLPPALLAHLRERLEESDVPYDVDVIDLSSASPEIRARIEREGVLWIG